MFELFFIIVVIRPVVYEFDGPLQNVEQSIVQIKLWESEMPVPTVDEIKNYVFLLSQKLSKHERSEPLKHVGFLMRWFNSNISHRSFIFLLKNDILKSPRNKILSY